MNRVLALVEGETEKLFVRDLLAPSLTTKGVDLRATMSGKPGRKGGARSWQRVRRDIIAVLKEDRTRYCTTMFDYYALPTDWPGVIEAKRKRFRSAVACVEAALRAAICEALADSANSSRFIPYIQLHEFEALLFSDPKKLAAVLQRDELTKHFGAILRKCKEPEAIDDDPQTAPSKRIRGLAEHFDKVVHGPLAAMRIGLERIRKACPHFAQWVQQLEGLTRT